jgi:protein gp37
LSNNRPLLQIRHKEACLQKYTESKLRRYEIMSTNIAWVKNTDGKPGETWNPIVGCTPSSPGCDHCYARELHNMRHKAYMEGKLQNCKQYAEPFSKVQLFEDRLSI